MKHCELTVQLPTALEASCMGKEAEENKIWPLFLIDILLLQVIPKTTIIEAFLEDVGETSFVFVYLYIRQESHLAPNKVELVRKKKSFNFS